MCGPSTKCILNSTVRVARCVYPARNKRPRFTPSSDSPKGRLLRSGSTAASFCFSRETGKFTGATFFAFLKALYRASTAGSQQRVVVIPDNARYHHAQLHRNWREEHLARFTLDYLPPYSPYSPDLNPIERVWKLTRRQCLHNRYFPLLSEVVDSVETQFKQWLRGNISLRRLCAIT